jgi:putative peptide zinc metalloprotease protein
VGLPRNIRQDLELIETAPYEDGSPRWRLYDPVVNRFYDLGWLEVEVMRELRSNSDPDLDSAGMAQIIATRANVICNSQQIDEFIEFLEKQGLFWMQGERALEERLKLREAPIKKFLPKIWQQYLFIRVPILHPDKLLDGLLPYVSWAFKPLIWWVLGLNTLIALYLTSRQLDFFLGTFVNYFTPLGLVYFSAAVIIAKILHEFGHALTARYFGCSVRAMGVALLMFWPILYTDTTDAWRMRSRYQRALIGAAGMMVELGIASVCLLLWNFLPDGFLRTILFMLSTSTWIMTLAVNLNPLMRFDGYYILSDLTGVENMQERSNAMGRWRLREWLFGFGQPAPEEGKRWLIFFSYAVWLYRLTIFFGICYLVYTYFFKALGVVLAIAQLFRLLIMPIGKEALVWWEMRESASTRQLRHTAIGLFVALLLIVAPLDNELELPAYWQAQGVVTLYAPISGNLQQLPAAYESQIAAGETVVVISSPDLRFELDQASHDVRTSKYQLERTSVNVGLAQDRLSLQAQLSGALAKRVDIKALLKDANLVAPFDASITSIQPDLRIGDWVSKGDNLLTLVDDRGGEIVAYLSESDLGALAEGARGRFYPEGGARPPFDVELVEVEKFALEQLEQIYVASRFGGSLDVRDGKDGTLIPQQATYRIHMQTEHSIRDRVLRGQLVLEADARSALSSIWRRAVGIWRREAGV